MKAFRLQKRKNKKGGIKMKKADMVSRGVNRNKYDAPQADIFIRIDSVLLVSGEVIGGNKSFDNYDSDGWF